MCTLLDNTTCAHSPTEYESTGGENLDAPQAMEVASNSYQCHTMHHLDLSSSSFPNWNEMQMSTVRSDYGYIWGSYFAL